jgi:hypothetical protein
MERSDLKNAILEVLARWEIVPDSELTREMIADEIVAEWWQQLPDQS